MIKYMAITAILSGVLLGGCATLSGAQPKVYVGESFVQVAKAFDKTSGSVTNIQTISSPLGAVTIYTFDTPYLGGDNYTDVYVNAKGIVIQVDTYSVPDYQ